MSFLHELFSGVCHQFPSRALCAGGFVMPLCARCAGMYAALAAVLPVFLARSGRARRPPTVAYMVVSAFAFVIWAADGAAGFLALWETPAWGRFAAGMLAGAFLSPYLAMLFHSALDEGAASGGWAGASARKGASGPGAGAGALPEGAPAAPGGLEGAPPLPSPAAGSPPQATPAQPGANRSGPTPASAEENERRPSPGEAPPARAEAGRAWAWAGTLPALRRGRPNREGGRACAGRRAAFLLLVVAGLGAFWNSHPSRGLLVFESWAGAGGLFLILFVAHAAILVLVFGRRLRLLALSLAPLTVAAQLLIFNRLRDLSGF